MSNNTENKVKVVVISPFTDKENDYLLRTPKVNNEYETTKERAKKLIELNDAPFLVDYSTTIFSIYLYQTYKYSNSKHIRS